MTCDLCGGDGQCKTCQEIDKVGEESWCFKWITQLNEYHACLETEKAERDRQIRLMVDHTDDDVIDIRRNLAIIQTQTPAWTLIELIKAHAELHAVECSHRLQLEKHEPNSDDDMASRIDNMVLKFKANLVDFVGYHINKMLTKLYDRIHKEEEEGGGGPEDFNAVQRFWFVNLYPTHGSKPLAVVGPVGDRPLHVCALSKYRFGDVDFEKQGNYFADGIDKGIRLYIKSLLKNKEEGWREVTMSYRKDYCAAVGDYIRRRIGHDEQLKVTDLKFKDLKNPGLVGPDPPFWDVLKTWYHKHLAQRKFFRTSKPYSNMLVTRGLYEGETILFPFLAENDEQMVSWLLDKEEDLDKQLPLDKDKEQPLKETETDDPSFLQTPPSGLFFHPMQRRCLTSFSVIKGWSQYMRLRLRDVNLEAASRRSYLGLSLLAFAASQGKVGTFNLLLNHLEQRLKKTFDLSESFQNSKDLRRALMNIQDEYGNTMLHLAAWDGQVEMIDKLVQLGADMKISNHDGLTPFTLAARYGVWQSFNHIWDKHATKTIWKFGNVEKRALDLSSFDWKGIKAFTSKKDVDFCLQKLVETIPDKVSEYNFSLQDSDSLEVNIRIKMDDLISKVEKVSERINAIEKEKEYEELRSKIQAFLGSAVLSAKPEHDDEKRCPQYLPCSGCSADVNRQKDPEGRSALRMITLFRPKDWYKQSKDKIENIIMEKWNNGYNLVHLGQSVVPYCILLIVFGMMWSERELNVLTHNFWWADQRVISKMKADIGMKVLQNPVVANISELVHIMNTSVFGSDPVQTGRLTKQYTGPESMCGWYGIRNSVSGRLQAIQMVYGILSLLRLSYIQRRIRPSDLDEDEDMKFSVDEMVNFVYFNLESLFHVILCGLYISIAAARISAGDACASVYLDVEKNATAIAGLVLFLNLMIVCKPFKGIGFLLLSMYKFLVTDVFYFLVMYSILFTGFLLALQTLNNANRVYLAWMDVTQTIFPQIEAVTDHSAYLLNHNPPDGANQLENTHMAMDGCGELKRAIYDTALTLLQISFGDGFSDALTLGRRSDYECAGLRPDMLTNYILVFWLFVTNVLVLNMLIAMMNSTISKQTENIHAVWLLDVSYRIMRFEKLFPELKDRMRTSRAELKNQTHTSRSRYSCLNLQFWQQLMWDILLVLYCIPEIHLWGFTHAFFVWIQSKVKRPNTKENSDPWILSIKHLTEQLKPKEFDGGKQNDNGRSTAVVKAQEIKGLCLDQIVTKIATLEDVMQEVDTWSSLFASKYCLVAKKELTPQAVQPVTLGNNSPLKNEHTTLLYISLIYRLDLLSQNFDSSFILHEVRQQEAV